MPQNATVQATVANGAASGLSPVQALALNSLLAGEPITQAAVKAGVDRSTVHRWLRTDWEFLAAYNEGRRELLEDGQRRLLMLTECAIAIVQVSLENGSLRAALACLKGLGLLGGKLPQIGLQNPEHLEFASEQAEKQFHDRWLKAHDLTPPSI
jgi:hypothetical protein